MLHAGGNDNYYLSGSLLSVDSADVYDEGRQALPSAIPVLAGLNPSSPGAVIQLLGLRFAPAEEASSGRGNTTSPTSYPQLVGLF